MKKILYYVLLFSIFTLGFFLRLKCYQLNPSLWLDECCLALNIKQLSYLQMFGVLDYAQIAPPFFMILTKFLTNLLGFSELVFRFIPLVSGLLSIIAFYFLAKKVLKSKLAILFSVFLFSVDSNLLRYSYEFKPYASDVFFTILCLLFFINLNIEKISVKKSFLSGLLLSLIPWFSFTPSFVIVGGFIILMFKCKKLFLKKKLALILPFFISGLIFVILYALSNYANSSMVLIWAEKFMNSNLLHSMSLIYHMVLYLFFPLFYDLFFLSRIQLLSIIFISSMILLIWGLILFFKEKSPFLNFACLTCLLLFISSILSLYPVYDRFILFLYPIALLLVTKTLDLVSNQNKGISILIIFLFAVTFLPQIPLFNYYKNNDNLSKKEYNREMMDYMVKSLKPTDIIFLDSNEESQFIYYSSFYHIKNKFVYNKAQSTIIDKDVIEKLKKGEYWMFLPLNFKSESGESILNKLIANKKIEILYSFNKQMSLLVHFRVN